MDFFLKFNNPTPREKGKGTKRGKKGNTGKRGKKDQKGGKGKKVKARAHVMETNSVTIAEKRTHSSRVQGKRKRT